MSPTSQLFGPTIIAGHDPSEMALTYDDGPNDACTGQLLDLLARHEVRATFFMIGRFVRERGDLARTVLAAGHLVGNHTVTHPVLLFQSPQRVREELAAANAALEDALGERVRYFRPPYGARRPDVLRAAAHLGLTPVMWNAQGNDWKATTAEGIVANLDRGIRRNRAHRRGSNLLLHDGGHAGIGQDRSLTIAATKLLLTREDTGSVRFVTVDRWAEHHPM
jgi:peptidoglycan/xylan/chitin deacetylase (PgdA/CDA1 family)